MIDFEVKIGSEDGGLRMYFDEEMIVVNHIAEGWLTAEEARCAASALAMMAMQIEARKE